MDLEIEYLPIGDLLPYAKNARTHSDAQVAKIASSIREFGFNNPILIDAKNGIVAGHGRLMAAQKLGLDAVPCVRLEHLNDVQRRAYILADNRLALDAGWDENMLALELQDLKGLGFDVDLTGFDAKELNDLLTRDPAEGLTDPDEIPPVPATSISQVGDVWQCGNHRVVCGDSTDLGVLDLLMANDKADLIITDPPYGVSFDQSAFRARDNSKYDKGFKSIANDEMTGEQLTEFIRSVFATALAHSKAVPCYCWGPPLRQGADILDGLIQSGIKIQSQIIWRKDTFVVGRADYQWQHEICWYGFFGKDHPWYGGRDKGTVWEVARPRKMELHPTTKPVELFEIGIRNSSKGGDIVLDMFGGSGTTMIACERLERHARLVDLEPVYVDVIVQRWQQFTGKQATFRKEAHVDDGKTFDEVAAARGKDSSALKVKVSGGKKK